MRYLTALWACVLFLLAGCGDSSDSAAVPPPYVKTWALESGDQTMLTLSGTVRARIESPLGFQVPGRIVTRFFDAGQQVKAKDVLFQLDPRDLEHGVQEAQASLDAATAARRIAQDDLKRHQQLLVHNAVSQQAAEQAELMLREAQARLGAAQARLKQARNALSYAALTAPSAGVLVDVTGEIGQVVSVGQAVALLAHDGEREIEVYLPEGRTPPETATLIRGDQRLTLSLREAAGAVDSQSRTLRARYRLPADATDLQLGSIVRVTFANAGTDEPRFVVPVSAVSERGKGPQVWKIVDGKVILVSVELLEINAETARISAPLKSGDVIVTLGTHLLHEGMAVREHRK